MQADQRATPVFDRPDDELNEPGAGVNFTADLRDMIDRAFCEGQRYKEQQHRADLTNAHPALLEVLRKSVRRLKKMGVPVFAHCVLRSPSDQARLYAKGLSNAKPGESPHQYGLAFDLIHGVKAWNLTDRQWAIIKHVVFEVAAACGVKLRWGGDWDGDGDIHDQRLYDPAHFELADWRDIGTKR